MTPGAKRCDDERDITHSEVLAERVMAGCEAAGFYDFAGLVEVFWGVDVVEADSAWVGFF